jgi:hypothetical protein
VHPLSIDTTTPGIASGSVNASSTSEAVANGSFSQPVSMTVLKHARPSFDLGSDVYNLNYDLGIRARGSTVPATFVQFFNRPDLEGFRADLDIDNVGVSGNAAVLSANVMTHTNLEPGGALDWSTSLNTGSTGSFTTTYTLTTSDEDLPGAMAQATLTISLTARVAIAGDANLDDTVNLLDFNLLAQNFGVGAGATWTQGDFTGDGAVTLLDFNALAANFGLSAGADGAVNARDWEQLAAAIPEPTGSSLVLLGALLTSRRKLAHLRRSTGTICQSAPLISR